MVYDSMFDFFRKHKPRVYRGKEKHQGKKIWITVKTRPFMEPLILYRCMNCDADLKSKFSEIETNDFCPICEHEFTVPGAEVYYEFHQILMKEKSDQAAAKKQAEDEKNRLAEEQKQKAEALKQQELIEIKREKELLQARLDLERMKQKLKEPEEKPAAMTTKPVVNRTGNWCPNCKNRDSYKETEGTGCMVMVIIFISLGLGLILLPFLPKRWHCRVCGNEWKA